MKIAIRNLHTSGIGGLKFQDYVIELVKSGYITHLYFENIFQAGVNIKNMLRTYSFKDLGLDKVKIIFSAKKLNEQCDVLLNFDSKDFDFTKSVKEFPGIKIFHLMDYFWIEPLSEKISRCEKNGIDYLISYGSPDKYCSYFKKYAPNYIGKVIPLPFGYNQRFVSQTPFKNRKKKCVAVGSVRHLRYPLVLSKNYEEIGDFLKEEIWFHKFRRSIVRNEKKLSHIIDYMLPKYPSFRDYDYDSVKKLNEYQLFVSDESIIYFPSAKTFEGPAAGSVMVCSNHPCFTDYGFIHEVNCIKHKEFDIDNLEKQISSHLMQQSVLEQISEKGREFVERNYSQKTVAIKFYTILEKILKETPKKPFVKERIAELSYNIYRNPLHKENLPEKPLEASKISNTTYLSNVFFYLLANATFVVLFTFINFIKRVLSLLRRIKNVIYNKPFVKRSIDYLIEKKDTVICYVYSFIDKFRKLPPITSQEKILVDNLRNKIKDLEINKKETITPCTRYDIIRKTLKENIINYDPRMFLSWPIIKNNTNYKINKLDLFQKNNLDTTILNKTLTRKNSLFIPTHSKIKNFDTNIIRQLVYLSELRGITGKKINHFNTIIDFSGGYGNMCKLINDLGFSGRYIMLDVPEFSLLQEFFLKINKINKKISFYKKGAKIATSGIILVNDAKDLCDIVQEIGVEEKTLLIATRSTISETPKIFRGLFFELENFVDMFLITYQKQPSEMDDEQFFKNLTNKLDKFEWLNHLTNYISKEENRYLIGIKNGK